MTLIYSCVVKSCIFVVDESTMTSLKSHENFADYLFFIYAVQAHALNYFMHAESGKVLN